MISLVTDRSAFQGQWDALDWLALTALLFFAVLTRVVFFTGHFGSDDIVYTSYPVAIANGSWPVSTYVGALRHGFNIPTALFISIFGPSDFTTNLWALLCSVGEVALVFVIARMNWGTRAASLCATMIACSPMHVHWAGRVSPDAALAFFITLSFLLFLIAEKQHTPTWYFAAGLAAGAVFWVKESALIVYAPVFAICALSHKAAKIHLLWMMLGLITMLGANSLLFLAVTGDPVYLFKAMFDTPLYDRFMASGDADTSVSYYLRYLFFDMRHTWLLAHLAVAGIFVWAKQTAIQGRVDKHTELIVVWGLGLLFMLTFFIIDLNPLTLIHKQTNYMLVFLAPLALLAGFFLQRFRGAQLAAVLTIVIVGSVTLAGLEQQAIHVFTSNSKAALLFAGEHRDAPVYGTQNAVNMSSVFPTIKTQESLPPIMRSLSELTAVSGGEELSKSSLRDGEVSAYVIVDMETLTWGDNGIVEFANIPECWVLVSRLQPVGFGMGAKVASILKSGFDWLPQSIGKSIATRLGELVYPKPAVVYRAPRNIRCL